MKQRIQTKTHFKLFSTELVPITSAVQTVAVPNNYIRPTGTHSEIYNSARRLKETNLESEI